MNNNIGHMAIIAIGKENNNDLGKERPTDRPTRFGGYYVFYM